MKRSAILSGHARRHRRIFAASANSPVHSEGQVTSVEVTNQWQNQEANGDFSHQVIFRNLGPEPATFAPRFLVAPSLRDQLISTVYLVRRNSS